MPFTIVLPEDTHFTVDDTLQIVNFIAEEAVLGTRFTSTQFTGSGTYQSEVSTYTAYGSGFSSAVTPGGLTYIATGTIDTVEFQTVVETMTITNVDLDMVTFAALRLADLSGADPFAIENYIMGRAWDLTLGDLDDVFPEGSTIGDGALLNTLGDDNFLGGRGNDDLFTGDGNDKLSGNQGNDTLSGGAGKDNIKGGDGDDILIGGIGRDRLFGQNDNDRLDSGKGDDVLHGGAGDDVFVFANKYGNDAVRDFDATNDNEQIDLTAVTRIKTFNDLMNNHISQDGANVVIDDTDKTIITLENVNLADLDAADFLF
ncbi:MAG: calcium-binding protein [Sedimentitalea sp.]|uniref:calcium-binding protein n=1 Tax=Sedimentitalea sp. TaxID=2048915 RepID=UPI0032651912